ncbi:putative transposase [Sphingobium sp. MI1205]|nr:putative transposase [Sphingobium sp. MI1205]
MAVPQNDDHLVAGLRVTGMVAPMVLEGPINGNLFEAYVNKVLAPDLKPGDVVIIDNLSSHKRVTVRTLIEAAGACRPTTRPQSHRKGLRPPRR